MIQVQSGLSKLLAIATLALVLLSEVPILTRLYFHIWKVQLVQWAAQPLYIIAVVAMGNSVVTVAVECKPVEIPCSCPFHIR